MQRYLVNRLLLIIPTVIIISFAIFLIFRLLPGDVALNILSDDGRSTVDPVEYQELRDELGLNDPLMVQYGGWLWDLVRLDGGKSLVTGTSVFSDLGRTLPITLELAAFAIVISGIIALPLGVIGALNQNGVWDLSGRLFTTIGLAMPSFLAGALLFLLLVNQFSWIPPLEFTPFFEDPVANLQQMIFPALVLGFASSAVLTRITRSSMLEVLRQDYVRTARAKGLSPGLVVRRHSLRNALLPLVTLAGIEVAFLLGGSVIVERIFVLPGLGSQMLSAIELRDWVTVQTVVTVFALSILPLNVILDVLYGWLDPRIRLGGGTS